MKICLMLFAIGVLLYIRMKICLMLFATGVKHAHNSGAFVFIL